MDDEPKFGDEYEFCCKKKLGCPRASLQSDGAVLSVPRAELVGGDGARVGIKFDAEQARELRKWLEFKGF